MFSFDPSFKGKAGLKKLYVEYSSNDRRWRGVESHDLLNRVAEYYGLPEPFVFFQHLSHVGRISFPVIAQAYPIGLDLGPALARCLYAVLMLPMGRTKPPTDTAPARAVLDSPGASVDELLGALPLEGRSEWDWQAHPDYVLVRVVNWRVGDVPDFPGISYEQYQAENANQIAETILDVLRSTESA